MKYLAFLILMVLSLNVFGQNAPDLLRDLRAEIDFLNGALLSIETASMQLTSLQQQRLQQNEIEQAALQKRIDFLELESKRLEALRDELVKDYNLLSESEGSLKSLIQNYESGEQILEGQIRLWRGIAIGSVVAVVAIVTYIIIKGVTE